MLAYSDPPVTSKGRIPLPLAAPHHLRPNLLYSLRALGCVGTSPKLPQEGCHPLESALGERDGRSVFTDRIDDVLCHIEF